MITKQGKGGYMKRSLCLVIAIAAIICFGWYRQNKYLEKTYTEASRHLYIIGDDLARRDYPGAEASVKRYIKFWEKTDDILSMFVSHDDIDKISLQNARLKAGLDDEGEAESLAVIGELYEGIKELNSKFKVNIKNIL